MNFLQEVEKLLNKPEEVKVKAVKTKTCRTPRAKEPSVSDLKWEIHKSYDRLDELEAQDETNFTDFDKSIKGKEINSMLVRNHITYYQRQIDTLREPFNPLLTKWKEFIVNLCKEKGKEIDKIWFDESAPYDCCVNVRLLGHRCWGSCVSFRFEEGKLKAFDSHFGGGTSFVSYEGREEDKVREVMERVFNEECSNSGWDKDDGEHRKIEIDDKGWLITKRIME